MTIICPTCKSTLTLPDDRLPKGKVVTAACPQCKGKILIDLTAPASAHGAVAGAAPPPEAATEAPPTPPPAPSAPPSEAPTSYGEQGLPLALVCVDDPAEREQAMAALKAQGYVPRTPASAADAIQRLRFMAYALVVLRDGYGSAGGDGNPVLDQLAEMGMATRRLMHVVFLSPGVRSHDIPAAFAKSVNLVLHPNDLPHLGEAVKRSREETDQAQRVLLESLRALGKA